MFSKKCKLHLDEVGETRWQHFKHACWVSWQLEKAAKLLQLMSRFLAEAVEEHDKVQ